jgi:hypothetical protein
MIETRHAPHQQHGVLHHRTAWCSSKSSDIAFTLAASHLLLLLASKVGDNKNRKDLLPFPTRHSSSTEQLLYR